MDNPHKKDIVLWTGYVVEYEEDWENHLVYALLGETISNMPKTLPAPVRERLIQLEAERVALLYELDYKELALRINSLIRETLGLPANPNAN